MEDIAAKLELLGLTDSGRQAILGLARLGGDPSRSLHPVLVETVIISEGHRDVVKREETYAQLVPTAERDWSPR